MVVHRQQPAGEALPHGVMLAARDRLTGDGKQCLCVVLVSVIEALADRDATFLDRFVSLPRHVRTRRYIALNRNELYPGRPDLVQEYSHQLRSGYWLGINISRKQVERIIMMACEVAGLRYGTDIKINLGQ
jgi:hypothetical protein